MAKLQSIEQFFEETPKYPIFTKTKKLLSFLDNFTISIELSKYRKKIYNIRKHILMIENHINDSFLRKSDDEVVADINQSAHCLYIQTKRRIQRTMYNKPIIESKYASILDVIEKEVRNIGKKVFNYSKFDIASNFINSSSFNLPKISTNSFFKELSSNGNSFAVHL